jgi:uncharacterized protein
MDRHCHIESQRSSPRDRLFNCPFPSLRSPRQCIGRLRSTRVAMLWLSVALLLCLLGPGLAFSFPPLSGRVVDQAGIMTAQSRGDLGAELKNLEDKSGIQVVVATVKSLEGSDVETYANQLFRNWRLGEAKKNNGVLLLVERA